MSTTTVIEPAHLQLASQVLARQAAIRERWHVISSSSQAEHQQNLAFALAIRFDLQVDEILSLLTIAPRDLRGARDILAWVDRVPVQSERETLQ